MRRYFPSLLLLALLSAIAYAPTLRIPLIADDYPNIRQALIYGSPEGAPVLLRDAVFRVRATSYWTMYLLWQAFGRLPAAYHLCSLALHIFNVWALYAVFRGIAALREGALWAAAFFAVAEGHQEAVMWFSAVNELWMCGFGLAALLLLQRGRWWADFAAVVLFVFALLSKESALIFVPMYALVLPWKRRTLFRLLPFAGLAALAALSVITTRSYSFRFQDGSFSRAAPFWLTWPRSFARLLWIWGWAALVVLGRRRELRPAALALAWAGVALIPYSFLTYSTAIPSRQTYLASAGLALLVGLALSRLRANRRLFAVFCTVVLLHNAVYLWTRKRTQFLERAAPTEQLIALAERTSGPIWMRCFPQPPIVAEDALYLATGRAVGLVWSATEAARRKPSATFCHGK